MGGISYNTAVFADDFPKNSVAAAKTLRNAGKSRYLFSADPPLS